MLRLMPRLQLIIWLVSSALVIVASLTGWQLQKLSVVNFWSASDTHYIRYVVDMNSESVTTIETISRNSAFSQDGKIATVVQFGNGWTDLFIGDSENSLNMLGRYSMYIASMAWLPDEDKLFIFEATNFAPSIVQIDVETGILYEIRTLPGDTYTMDYSPDGRYAVIKGIPDSPDNGWIFNIATGDNYRFGIVNEHTWSPDSRYIAYVHTPTRANLTEREVRIFAVDTGEIVRFRAETMGASISDVMQLDLKPVWSPDSEQVALTLWDASGTPAIYTANRLTHTVEKVLDGNYTVQSWSQDGRYLLAEITHPDEREAIHLINLETKARRVLLELDRINLTEDILWSPDGSALAFNFTVTSANTRTFQIYDSANASLIGESVLPLREYFPTTTGYNADLALNWFPN